MGAGRNGHQSYSRVVGLPENQNTSDPGKIYVKVGTKTGSLHESSKLPQKLKH